MLKKRIIPVLLLKNGRLIKTVKFADYRDVGNPITTAKIYDAQGADELVFLDVAASGENRGTLLDIIQAVAKECFMPLGVGGGIKTLEDIRILLQGGADKVIVNTAAVENPEFITAAAQKFGSSTIVVSIDFKKNNQGKNEVYIRGGTQGTGLDPVDWAKKSALYGAGEILFTSIDLDGTLVGLNIELIREVADQVTVPVIGAGGVGTLLDFKRAFTEGHASAVGAGSIFHFTDQNLIKTRRYLIGENVAVRR